MRQYLDLMQLILDQGIDGVVINLITNGEEPGIVDLAGRTLGPLVGK